LRRNPGGTRQDSAAASSSGSTPAAIATTSASGNNQHFHIAAATGSKSSGTGKGVDGVAAAGCDGSPGAAGILRKGGTFECEQQKKTQNCCRNPSASHEVLALVLSEANSNENLREKKGVKTMYEGAGIT
jgi:hypothetical protein